jgi:hypothetical protein
MELEGSLPYLQQVATDLLNQNKQNEGSTNL